MQSSMTAAGYLQQYGHQMYMMNKQMLLNTDRWNKMEGMSEEDPVGRCDEKFLDAAQVKYVRVHIMLSHSTANYFSALLWLQLTFTLATVMPFPLIQ